MAGQGDRTDWLREVERELRMPVGRADEIIEELETHIDGARREFMEAGIDEAEAERRAIRLMGQARDVARGLRRAHQSRKRLLAAVGGAVFNNLLPTIATLIGSTFVACVVLFAPSFVIGVFATLLGRTQVETGVFFLDVAMVGAVVFTVWRLGEILPLEIGIRANRRTATLRRPVALVGAVLIAAWAWFGSWEYTAVTVPLAFVLPLVFWHGAGRSGRFVPDRLDRLNRAVRRRLSWRRALVAAPFAAAVLFPLTFLVTGPAGRYDTPSWHGDTTSLVAAHPEIAAKTIAGWTFGATDYDGILRVFFEDDAIDWDNWSDLRLEAWPAAGPRHRADDIPPGAVPLFRVPVDPWERARTMPRSRHTGNAWILVTGIDRDTGERVALGWPRDVTFDFRGSLFDWFGAQP